MAEDPNNKVVEQQQVEEEVKEEISTQKGAEDIVETTSKPGVNGTDWNGGLDQRVHGTYLQQGDDNRVLEVEELRITIGGHW
eukprot:CAMPEP_0201588456 /NCGR_PEP_ID=MMETSP0190_2-20130828/155414_1 /ASSEMBLY_ACC=CAM_ASM_000263 /TAXON_ID=37353 /ORGANISM="Rosalina sp." /LENGTH=81 /DNA_ID=CAMNT_0048040663 /DNA_START=15 /DNA_END=257 /DNA_ORIENTATION=+